ncbi:MAG: DUF962 domain-containing protein [Polyangiaceae bacterium]|nr:DUF962 domain-containing protein [Polyangiaceae bacterium]
MSERFESFEEFWPFYVKEHADRTNRRLHFVGTSLALACLAGAALTRRTWLLLAAPVAGYGFAWAGHYLVQKNRPATFTHPLWSLRGDLVMWSKMLDGTMDAEVERVLREEAVVARAEADAAGGVVDPVVNLSAAWRRRSPPSGRSSSASSICRTSARRTSTRTPRSSEKGASASTRSTRSSWPWGSRSASAWRCRRAPRRGRSSRA